MTVSFKVTPAESATISRIVDRYAEIGAQHGHPLDQEGKLQVRMSITACHANGCPLRLDDLAKTDDFNLLHDVGGIHDTISRITGKIEGHFLPRFAQPHESREKKTAAE